MEILRRAAGVFLALAACATALACSCGGPVGFCEQLPDRSDTNTAVFVGKVKTVQETGMERQVRFQVMEDFAGAAGRVFDLVTHVQASACGAAFAPGESYLVEAHRQAAAGGWQTSLCSRTIPLDRAAADLHVLRAWKSGRVLRGTITGEVWDPLRRRNLAKVRIILLGTRMVSAITDEKGQFRFENLEPGTYEMEAQLPSGTRRLTADLTRAWCARVVIPD